MCGLLRALQHKGPSFDTSFWLYQRRRQIKQEDKSSNVATMSVVTRIKFETAKVNSDKSVMAAMEKQVCSREGGAETTVGYLSFGPIERYIMFFVTSACSRRTGAAARVERRRASRSDTRAASQAFERMHNTLSHRVKT